MVFFLKLLALPLVLRVVVAVVFIGADLMWEAGPLRFGLIRLVWFGQSKFMDKDRDIIPWEAAGFESYDDGPQLEEVTRAEAIVSFSLLVVNGSRWLVGLVVSLLVLDIDEVGMDLQAGMDETTTLVRFPASVSMYCDNCGCVSGSFTCSTLLVDVAVVGIKDGWWFC